MARIAIAFPLFLAFSTILGCASGEKVITKEETFPDGRIKSRVQYHIRDGNEVLWGEATYYYVTGGIELKCENANGKRHGPYETYYDNGGPKEFGSFAYGNRDGEWLEWDKEGNVKKTMYVAGKIQKG